MRGTLFPPCSSFSIYQMCLLEENISICQAFCNNRGGGSKFGRSLVEVSVLTIFKEYIYFLKIYIFQSNYFLGLLVKSVENS